MRRAQYDDVGGELTDMARLASRRAIHAANVVALVVDVQRAAAMRKVQGAGVGDEPG